MRSGSPPSSSADGIASNALWPRTLVATAAVQNLLGGDAAMARARTPDLYADAAYAVITRPSREYTGQALLCEDVLVAVRRARPERVRARGRRSGPRGRPVRRRRRPPGADGARADGEGGPRPAAVRSSPGARDADRAARRPAGGGTAGAAPGAGPGAGARARVRGVPYRSAPARRRGRHPAAADRPRPPDRGDRHRARRGRRGRGAAADRRAHRHPVARLDGRRLPLLPQRTREPVRSRAQFTGRDIDGGYAEWTVADGRYAFPLPGGLHGPRGGARCCARA